MTSWATLALNKPFIHDVMGNTKSTQNTAGRDLRINRTRTDEGEVATSESGFRLFDLNQNFAGPGVDTGMGLIGELSTLAFLVLIIACIVYRCYRCRSRRNAYKAYYRATYDPEVSIRPDSRPPAMILPPPAPNGRSRPPSRASSRPSRPPSRTDSVLC